MTDAQILAIEATAAARENVRKPPVFDPSLHSKEVAEEVYRTAATILKYDPAEVEDNIKAVESGEVFTWKEMKTKMQEMHEKGELPLPKLQTTLGGNKNPTLSEGKKSSLSGMSFGNPSHLKQPEKPNGSD